MKRHSSRPAFRALLLAALAVAATWTASGCASRRAASVPLRELSQAELDRFLDAGINPRTRGITILRGAAGPEFAEGNRPWLGKVAATPLRRISGRMVPVVDCRTLDKNEYTALIDTSARHSWLRYDSIGMLGFRVFHQGSDKDPVGEYADHVSSAIPGYAGSVNKIVVGKLSVEYPVFYVPPGHGTLGPWTRSCPAWSSLAPRLHMVLGNALLKKFNFVRIDGISGQVVWSTQPLPAPKKVLSAEMGDWRGRPTVRVNLGGIDVDAVVDTAGDFDVAVPADWLSAPLPPEGVEMPLRWGNTLFDVPLTVTTLEAAGLPADWPPRLGWRFWRHGVLTLDYQHHRVWFESPFAVPPAADSASSAPSSDSSAPAPVRYRGIRP